MKGYNQTLRAVGSQTLPGKSVFSSPFGLCQMSRSHLVRYTTINHASYTICLTLGRGVCVPLSIYWGSVRRRLAVASEGQASILPDDKPQSRCPFDANNPGAAPTAPGTHILA